MAVFDASKNWTILVPPGAGVKKAAEDLAACIGLLRGTEGKNAELADSLGAAPPPEVPLIVLNSDSGYPEGRGFSWRLGSERIEIYGQGEGGLCKGIYDFLASMGIKWPKTGLTNGDAAQKTLRNMPEIQMPTPERNKTYVLKNADASQWPEASSDGQDNSVYVTRKRLVITQDSVVLKSKKKRTSLLRWAMRNCFDAIVFPFTAPPEAFEETKSCALEAEAGGWALSFLVPRRLFFFNREIFRMEAGKRRKNVHFCPTNPDTIAVIRSETKKLSRIAQAVNVIHLWPEKDKENIWCACPACRAFTFTEQYRIAANAAVDTLTETNPKILVSVYENNDADEEGDILLRKNIFSIDMNQVEIFKK